MNNVTFKTINYAVLCTPRTGSSLLDEMLRNSHNFGVPREYLLGFRDYSTGKKLSSKSIHDFFLDLRINNVKHGYFGIKIMKNQFNKDIIDVRLLSELLPNVCYIYLYRKDTLRQAISWYFAEKTNIWKGDYGLENLNVSKIDLDDIFNKYITLNNWNREWEDILKSEKCNYITVSYEELIQTNYSTFNKITTFLGSNKDFIPNKGTFEKQMKENYALTIINKIKDKYPIL